MLTLLAATLVVTFPPDPAPIRPITQWVHTRWTARDGAPADVRALAQTADGYLWIGTATALVRFDGIRFVPFAPVAGDTMPGGGVRRLLAARDGSLWVVWRAGTVSRLRHGRVTSYGERDGLPVAFQLAESGSGRLVAATAKGLSRFTEGRWTDAGREWGYPGAEARALWYDRDDGLWVETSDRVVHLPADGARFTEPGLPLRGAWAPADFAQEKDGTIWMAELQRSAHTLAHPRDRQPMTEVLVGSFNLLIDRRGSLWVGSVGDGLRRVPDPARIRGKRVARFGPEAEHFTERDGLLSDVVLALLEDREGGIWVGTSRGLERFREGAFAPIPTPGSVRPRWVFAARDTSVWVGAVNLYVLDRIGLHEREVIPATGMAIPHLAQDPVGVLWTVSRDGIYRLMGRRFVRASLRPGTARNLVAITLDPSGAAWVCDAQLGVLRLEHDSLVPVAPLDDPAAPCHAMHGDRRGRVWVGRRDGVVLYDRGRLTTFEAATGAARGEVHGFYEDRSGNIWVASEGGVTRFDGRGFRALPDRAGLPGGSAFGVVQDDAGAWWIANHVGVFRLPPGELERALSDSTHLLRFRQFDELDGLPGVVTHAPWGGALALAPDGRIWVATDSGVASADPRRLPRAPAPEVHIESVRAGGRELLPVSGLAIPPGSGELEIDYTATSLALAERVRFRVQLEGEERQWREVGARRQVAYAGLRPGAYRFRVIASAGDGAWNGREAAWTFRILPAWYQTVWFRGAVVLLIGGVGAGSAALVQRRRHRRAQRALRERYEATLAERARIAQELHDTLLQGFAGVTLQLKTAEMALPERPDVAAETIMRVKRLAHESLREARERVWDMHDGALADGDLVAALGTFARERAEGTGIVVEVRTIGAWRRVPRPVEEAAFRVGREALVNAVKHAQATRIEIVVEFADRLLRLEVHDDGRGLTPDQAAAARRRGHLGLTGMRDRVANVGGRCEVRPREGGGTIVWAELPLGEARRE